MGRTKRSCSLYRRVSFNYQTQDLYKYINKTEVTDYEIIRLTLPSDYPFVAPILVMESSPISHPDWWYESKRWNCGCYDTR